MIHFSSMTKAYGSLLALQELTLNVGRGEVYALLGPNGAGKTTALRCLATLLRPTAGTGSVAGHDVLAEPLKVRGHIGFLSASMGLYERLTARERVEDFGRLHGMEGTRLETAVEGVVELFGLGAFAGRHCGTLSTGQRQRVSVARAIVHDPPALILDEPTVGLDVVSGQTILEFIVREKARDKAVLFSTHHMDEVELLADRVGILSRGRLVAEGTVEGLLERTGQASLAKAFLGLVEATE
jgi:sodium transport system ATP-binding protein